MTSRTESSPRKIKRIKKEKENQNKNDGSDSVPKNDAAYNFYRIIIHPMILRLLNQKDKLNYSHWLTKLDTCDDPDYKLPLIKMLFISLKNNRTLKLYAEPPVDDLSELNLDSGDSTMDMLRKAQEDTNEYYILANEELLQEMQHKRSAAVSTDLCSYIASKTSRYLAQSFYVRSDFPIQTWHNPASIKVPKTIDHNQWELYLNRFDLLMDDPALWENELHQNTCESIINLDQVQKELNINCIFRWHPHSLLYSVDRPKRSAGFVNIDQDIQTQPANQQQLDESAFTIVHNKSFPGYKMLSPKIYSTILMPDPDFVFNMTGVRIIHNNVSHISNDAKDMKNDLKTDDFQQIILSKTCTINSDKSKPFSMKATQNKSNCHKPSACSEYPHVNKVKTESICKSNGINKTNKPFANLKCANKSLKHECNSKSRIICEPNVSSKKPNSFCLNNQNKSCMKNQKVSNVKQYNISNLDKFSMNDTSSIDRSNLSCDNISSAQNAELNCSNTCQNISNNCTEQQMEIKYDLVSCMKPENQNVQNISRNPRQCNNENDEKRRSSISRANNLYSVQPQKEYAIRKNNSKRQPKTKLRSTSVPCNYDRMNKSQNSCKTRSEFKHNDTDILNEGINKYALSTTNKYSNTTEKISKPKYDENWDSEKTDYSEFRCRNYCNDGESSPITGKYNLLQRRTSLNNLPRDLNILSSDESCNSDWSTETGFNKLSSNPTYCNSFDSITTITSGFSSIETSPGHVLDSSRSSKCRGSLNSLTKYTNNVNQINRNCSVTDEYLSGSSPGIDYTNIRSSCPFDNSQKVNSNAINIREVNSYDLIDTNIENTSFPRMSYEESCSSTSLLNVRRDLQDMSTLNSYETPCSDDN